MKTQAQFAAGAGAGNTRPSRGAARARRRGAAALPALVVVLTLAPGALLGQPLPGGPWSLLPSLGSFGMHGMHAPEVTDLHVSSLYNGGFHLKGLGHDRYLATQMASQPDFVLHPTVSAASYNPALIERAASVVLEDPAAGSAFALPQTSQQSSGMGLESLASSGATNSDALSFAGYGGISGGGESGSGGGLAGLGGGGSGGSGGGGASEAGTGSNSSLADAVAATGQGAGAPASSLGVPEPGTWCLLIAGFGLAGAMLRRARISSRQLCAPVPAP